MKYSDLHHWHLDKPTRRRACVGLHGYERRQIIEHYQRRKRIAENYNGSNNDVSLRGTYAKVMFQVELSRFLLNKPGLLSPEERKEKKRIIRRSLEQCRNLRLDCGLPKAFYPGQAFFIGPNKNIPTYSLEDAFKAGAKLNGIAYVMSYADANKIVDHLVRTRHNGLWAADMLERETSSQSTIRTWTFWFEDEADLMLFKLKYSGKYDEE